MKETVERGVVGPPGAGGALRPNPNPYDRGALGKPVIAAINGFAMGGGFMLAERADLRVAVRGAIFEMSEAKRWLLGGYNHGFVGGMTHAVATEMAFAFRFPAERLYELGWLNRLVDEDQLSPAAREMAAHLLTLPPASRVNTLAMMQAMRPRVPDELEALANRLRDHGAREDLMESRQAFAEKRTPRFKGWDDPEDRYRTPTLESIRQDNEGS
jgi:enoyl-CoA hydratase/carnithine racemase